MNTKRTRVWPFTCHNALSLRTWFLSLFVPGSLENSYFSRCDLHAVNDSYNEYTIQA
jgi:hypothetical protein